MNEDLMGGGIAPKRMMSDEHKAKMKAGREAARSRSRPSSRAEAAPLPKERSASTFTDQSLEDVIDSLGSGEHLTRESRSNGDNSFDIPLQGRREGWDYQWWPTHIVGQEIDPSYQVEISRGSWFPVPASHFPQLCPAAWSRPTIDRQGMRLFMRPMRLTLEAKQENQKQAFEQKANRLAAAQAGDGGRDFARRVNPDGSPAAQIDVGVRPLI